MTGRLAIVGIGPGAAELVTPLAAETLAAATDLVGYGPYLARVPERPGQTRHASDNREELARAREALALAASGKNVAVVSSGDPGVFAMASAVFEAIETGLAGLEDHRGDGRAGRLRHVRRRRRASAPRSVTISA